MEADLEVVGEATNDNEALALALALRPDVACLEIRIPGRDGTSVARELYGPDVMEPIPVLVLVLTTFDLDDYIFGALEAGLSAFLLKDAEPDAITTAIRQVAAGHGTIHQMLARRIMREFVQRRSLPPVTTSHESDVLTSREQEILRLLAQGMSNG